MNLVPVNEVPNPRRRSKHDLQGFIRDFEYSGIEAAKIEFNDKDYVSSLSCYKCLFNAITRMKYNAIVKVVKCGDEVYLTRKVV